MAWLVAAALVLSWWSLARRLGGVGIGSVGGIGLRGIEELVIVSATWLAAVGIVATGLASISAFHPPHMALSLGVCAALVWPWGRPRARAPSGPSLRELWPALIVVVAGMALRLPLSDYALAGRDQGTYELRAEHTLRTGALHLHDPVLSEASIEAAERSGPGDLLGLYPTRGDRWAQDRYEGAYRPGLYLADREGGVVVPQFFHLHPMLMATAGLVLGPARVTWVLALEAALALLAIWSVARRLWPRGPWAWLAVGLVIASPLAIWVHRTALTEVPATLLLWAAVLAFLRAREDERELVVGALLLGATAWLRGHAWLVAPIVATLVWLVPPGARAPRRASAIYVGVVVLGVMAHAGSIYPYLHDELARQLPGDLHPSPHQMMLAGIAGLLSWWAVDELWGARRGASQRATWWLQRAPVVLVGGVGLVFATWALARGGEATTPWSRLDPIATLLGVPWLAAAALGLVLAARVRLRPCAADVWLVAIAASIVVTAGLYAQRNLPRLQLYYYGRYLAPEMLVVAALAATAALAAGYRALVARGRALALAVTGALTAGLGWSVAGVLVTHPVTRLREFEGAGAAVDHLIAQLPEDAIVIAGGEGWHHGHTWNQVGGALALRTGITVLPYRTREAAYATLHELLIAAPSARGTPPPPVFVLLNEATKPYTREDGTVVAGLDDLLPPPFSARRMHLVELVVDRLSPTSTELPTRVTRDGLRMALVQVVVDPTREPEVERFAIAAGKTPRGQGILRARGGRPRGETACLDDRKALVVDIPAAPDGTGAGAGPVSLVLVATPGTARNNPGWTIEIDGEPVDPMLAHAPVRARDTLGPFVLAERPRTVSIRGSAKTTKKVACARGGLAELRLLGPERAALADPAAAATAITFAPSTDLGVPVEPAAWVSARGLSRYRAGLTPPPEIHAVSMVLGAGETLGFPLQFLPDAGATDLDLVVTLTRSHVEHGAELLVLSGERVVARLSPPPSRDRSWQSPVVTLASEGLVDRLGLRLLSADASAAVEVRDIGLFSRAPPQPGARSR